MKRSIMNSMLLLMLTLFVSCNSSNQQKNAGEKTKQKPNIIYILADDLGYGDLSCYGSTKIKTPGLDKMAAEGMKFINHYSGQTVCSPSRCALMTGMHMGHASVKKNGVLLNPDDVTIAELLKTAGYKTGGGGKWGLSEGPDAPNSPTNKGFDRWLGYDNQGFAHFHYPEFLWRNKTKVEYPENVGIRNENGYYIEGKGTYSHDEFTKEALSFIKENKDESFFLYLPYAVPHAELVVPAESRKPYEELGWPETPKIKPGYKQSNSKNQGYGSQYVEGYCAQEKPNATYAGMVSRMDRDVSRILDLLEKLNIAENTIVMFGSDNGPSDEGGQDLKFFNSSAGFRGKKRDVYEGGVHTPFIAYWKGTIKPGVTTDLISHFSDFLPTACDLAGIQTPDNVDGVSLVPTLLGKDKEQVNHKYLYWEWRDIKAIRSEKWKFFYMNATKSNQEPIYELYDLEKDPAESNNVVAAHPELIDEFLAYIKEATE